MSEPHDRLKQAREAAGYETAVLASAALGVPYGTYSCHENGSRGFTEYLDQYARKFRVRAEWLRNGIGAMKYGEQPPIVEKFEELTPDKQKQVIDYIEFLKQTAR